MWAGDPESTRGGAQLSVVGSRTNCDESLLVKGGVVVHADGRERADVLVRSGRIAAIGHDLPAGERTHTIPADGLLVLPGGIDVHTHFDGRFMGASTSDDFWSGGVCASIGGITTHVDMCIPEAGEPLSDAIERWRGKAADKALCDYGFHATVVNGSVSTPTELLSLIEAGCPSFKLFMAYEGLAVDDATILDVMQICRDHGAMPVVHAENLAATEFLTRALVGAGRTEPRWHPVSRPPEAEAEATARVIALAGIADAPVYIAHVTCRAALEAVAGGRRRGQHVYAETEPHYLALTGEVYDAAPATSARFVCSPPIRGREDQTALKAALRDGLLTGVASDHCPIALSDRLAIGGEDFSRMPNGVGTIEFLRPVLWTTCVVPGLITPERFVELTATVPARTFGIAAKGRVAVGLDADLVLWDPDARWRASQETSHSRVDYCVLEGFELQGRATLTIRRGEVVWDGVEILAVPGSGEFIARAQRDVDGTSELPRPREQC